MMKKLQPSGILDWMAGMKQFDVCGPYDVPLDAQGRVARSLKVFWQRVDERESISAKRGVYLFAMRAGTGYTPIYVGKAGKTRFRTEAFGPHKRYDHYNPALRDYVKATPVMFFVVHPPGRGKPSYRIIDEIESALISLAWKKNRDLSNVRKKPRETWSIRGVLLASQGQPSKSAKELRRTLSL